jgi:Ca-activated chloride channel homolog
MSMSLLAPFSLLLSLLAVPVLVMYMLKLRRREVKVSSTLLWHAVLRDRQANTPWQKLRRNLFLFLQLIILACLVMALARPAMAIPSVSSGSTIVILDASASMQANDVEPSRFEAARAIVGDLIDGLSDNAHMTLIQAGFPPKVLVSSENDRSKLHQALQEAAPTNGTIDWKTSFALAAGAASSGQESQPPSIVIISDGGLPEDELLPLPGEVSFIPVGASADNLAISALALREVGSNLELFAKVSNFSDQTRQVLLSIYRNEALLNAQTIDVPSKGQSSISLKDLPPGEAIFKARLEKVDSPGEKLDTLPLDDTAFAVNQVQKNRRLLVISEGNFFLEQVLSALPGVTAYRALPAPATSEGSGGGIQLPQESSDGQGSFDLYILDGILPIAPDSNVPVLPKGNLLLINPPPTALFNVTGSFTDTQNTQVADHPLTQYLDWREVHIAKARHVQMPAWAEMLVSSGTQPLVFAGETEGRRIAALTFDLRDSDLPLQIAFPILFANLIDYLAPAQSINPTGNILPGEGVSIVPGPGVGEVAIASPLNRVYTLPPDESGLLFSETGELGVYAVNFLKEKTQTAEFFAVNLFNDRESNIKPVDTIQVGRTRIGAVKQEKLGKRELWPWFALSAFSLLILEWWIYHRRP